MDTLIWAATSLVASLILPPGVFMVLLAAALAWGRKYGWARWLGWASLLGFVLMSLGVVGYALVRPLEVRWPPLDGEVEKGLKSRDAMIVVLGGGRTLGAIEYRERETLSSASLRRSVYAAQLARRTELPLAVSGGGPGGGVFGEAVLMRNLIENGFGQRVALVESRSLDTRQNAVYMAEALAERKIGTVVLVTDVAHMPRAARAFESAGLKVVAAPMNFHASAPLNVSDFVPSVDGLELSRSVIREYVGSTWYELRRLAVSQGDGR